MMGDNRDNSKDSRFYGIVEREQIVGEAKRVLLSFDLNNWLKPRLSRFGEALQ
jgi:signal peptidase I